MDTKYYTTEEIKQLGYDKLIKLVKNNILNSKNKDFIINLNFTYNNIEGCSLFDEESLDNTIFGDDIYIYGSIYYDEKEKEYIAFGTLLNDILNTIFTHNYDFIENIYNSINNKIIIGNNDLNFIFNDNTEINVNNKNYLLYENIGLLFNINKPDCYHYISYILPNTNFYASLKLHKFELNEDNNDTYELRLYINKIELPTNTFTKLLIKKSNYYKNYIYKYTIEQFIYEINSKLDELLDKKDENKINQIIKKINIKEKEDLSKNILLNIKFINENYNKIKNKIEKYLNKNNIKIKMFEQYTDKINKIENLKQINNELNNTLQKFNNIYNDRLNELQNILNKL